MELKEALNWRYATKRMNGQKVSAEKVNKILDAIHLSASSLGLQPYHVFVVESEAIRRKIHEKANVQPQILESSHVLIFTAFKDITPEYIDNYISMIANVRNIPEETLADFKNAITGSVEKRTKEFIQQWTAKQAYIAMGNGLVAAAFEGVDSTPMEGFDADEVDKILNLQDTNLHTVLMLPLGYRDEENDYLSKAQKVRFPKKNLFTHL